MALTKSATNISLTGTVLQADCRDSNGVTKTLTYDLNRCLGNRNGCFYWGWQNFVSSSRELRLEGCELKAQLQNGDGIWSYAGVDINEYLSVRDDGIWFDEARVKKDQRTWADEEFERIVRENGIPADLR